MTEEKTQGTIHFEDCEEVTILGPVTDNFLAIVVKNCKQVLLKDARSMGRPEKKE